VPLVRTPSSLRSALRPVMEWFTTHSQTRALQAAELLTMASNWVLTVTTDVLPSRTSC